MNLIFYNYFGGLVTNKSIVSNQIMITRKAASDMVKSAVEIGILSIIRIKGLKQQLNISNII